MLHSVGLGVAKHRKPFPFSFAIPSPAINDTVTSDAPAKAEPEKSMKQRTKLAKLPAEATIEKRPINHPTIPSPYASADSPKVVYVQSKSSYVHLIKVVRSHLSRAEKRSTQSLSTAGSSGSKLDPKKVEKAIASAAITTFTPNEEVFVKATGKAIEKALEVALYFQDQSDCKVRIETGSVEVIDDLSVKAGKKRRGEEKFVGREEGAENVEEYEAMAEGHKRKRVVEELPESRVRQTSVVSIAISLR